MVEHLFGMCEVDGLIPNCVKENTLNLINVLLLYLALSTIRIRG